MINSPFSYIYRGMLTEEKIKEVKRKLRRGEPEGELKNQLTREGYTKEEIDSVFGAHHYDMRSWYLFFGSVISVIGVYLLITNGNWLLLALGALLFLAYVREIRRLKKSG